MAAPQVTPITENWHAEGFIVSEANGRLSRDQGILASGQNVKAGTVLGIVLGTTGTAAATHTNAGSSTFGTITVAEPAIPGIYELVMLSSTTFALVDPDGDALVNGTLGVAYTDGGLGFTLTTGGSPAAGDAFTITVGGQYAVFDPTATDGSAIARAIALNDTDATSAAHKIGLFARSGEVNNSELVWGTNVTTAAQKTLGVAQLAGHGIVAR